MPILASAPPRRAMSLHRALPLAALAFTLAAGALSPALADETVRVRGTVASFDGATALAVTTREGQTATIALKPDFAVSGVAKAQLSDVKPGDFVGIASLPKQDGGSGALEVLIFPAAMKGTGEGSYAWDLKPNSTMTNGAVADMVKSVDGQTLTVAYHGQSKKITVTDATPVVTFAQATKADVKPGATVFVVAQKDAQGQLTAARMVVGTNGVVPPM